MTKTFRSWDVDQSWLLPRSVHEFVPEGHLAHFVRDTVREGLDLSTILACYGEERGFPPYHPGMMVALLLYGYSRGIYSSRQLARACEERVDMMAVTGLNQPDFRTISDFRKRHLAALSDLFVAIWRWGRRLRPEALRLFGIESGRSPCHATYHYFFQGLDADALVATLGRYARGETRGGHIALDGKTLKGSRRLDAAPLHVLSAFATELGAVIGDLLVPPEANEITAALTLLKELPLEGAIVTGDAIFAQREICRHVRDAKGYYLFVVKTNQPELHRDIAIAFGDASPL